MNARRVVVDGVEGVFVPAELAPKAAAGLHVALRWHRRDNGGQVLPELEELADLLARVPVRVPVVLAEEEDAFVRSGSAARALGITSRAVRKRCDAGQVPGARRLPNGRWLIPESYLSTTEDE